MSNALPGFDHCITELREASAEERGRNLSALMREPLKQIDRATGYIESHTPLFAGSAADPQRRLFNDPTFDC